MSGNLSDVQIPDATTTARGLMTPSQVVDLNEVSYRETLAAAEETVIDAADEIGFADSSSGLWKRISWTNFIEGLGSIVLDGGSQNDLLIWNDTSGQWEPATPIETKDILGLGISDSPSFSNLILNGSAPTINLGESASTDSLILSAGTSGTYDGATIFMRGANYPSDPSDITMAVDGTISFKLRGSDKYFGFGEGSPTAKVSIRGPGSDSSTFTFKACDVARTELFSVRDDGLISFKNWALPTDVGTAGQILSTNGVGVSFWSDSPGGPPTGAASGDLSGTYPSPTVAKIQNVDISAAAPSDGQVLTYDTTNGWQPETPSTEPTGAASGDLSGTYPSPTVAKIQNVDISAAAPSDGQVLTYDTTNGWQPETPSTEPTGAASGDLSGTYPSPTVAKIQNVDISAAAPSDGQVLTYDTTNGWQPETPSAGGSGYWLQGTGYLYPATAGDAVRAGDEGFTFVLDSDTGLRRSGTNTMELFAGTQAKQTINTTGVTIPTLAVTTLDIDRLKPTGGTSAAPTFAKSSDIDTGVNLPGLNVMELVAGTEVEATITTSGVTIPTLAVTTLDIDRLKPTGGTSAAPTFAKSSDIDTGVNLPGLNVMELVAGAQAKATIATTGVTIPTLTVTTLTIDRLKPTGGTTALPEFSIPGDPNTGVHLATLDVLELVTAAQSRITISGNDISIGMDTADFVAFFGSTPVARQAELTDELTDNITAITHTSPTTPDYAIQDLTDTGGFGFATKDEGNTVLAQIRELQLQVKNLRTRNIQLEDKLVAYGLLPDTD